MKNQPFFSRLRFACKGIQGALRHEASFRFQCVAGLVALLLLVIAGASPTWWALFLLTMGGVLSSELVNTSLEHLLDKVHPEHHPTVGFIKDCAAGAVLIWSLISLAVFASFIISRVLD